jgi:hypothetical protein
MGEPLTSTLLDRVQLGIIVVYGTPPTIRVVTVVLLGKGGTQYRLAGTLLALNAKAPPITARIAKDVKMIFAFFIVLMLLITKS